MSTINKLQGKPSSVKPVGRLDASMLLARKGEATPAIAATTQNNPGLAWGQPAMPVDADHPAADHNGTPQAVMAQPNANANEIPRMFAGRGKPTASARLRPSSFVAPSGDRSAQTVRPRTQVPDRDPIAMTMRMEDETYMRLKYLAQSLGRSTHQVLNEALDQHLARQGVPQTRKMVVKPEE